jgi:type II secretory pathway pseudopilin PulG
MAMSRLTPQPHRREAGITLIELVAAMAILGVITTLLIAGWINLQRASAFAVQMNDARATARDALSRVSNELRDAQPASLPTASPPPTYVPELLTDAQPMSATFFSVFNEPGAGADVSGASAKRLTRLWLDEGTQQLWWARDVDNDGAFAAGDRQILLATHVVNALVEDTTVTPDTDYTAVFRYAYVETDESIHWTDNADGALDLATIISVRVRLIVDANLARSPLPIDVTTTILPRNAVAY